jgi:hypothetical protein
MIGVLYDLDLDGDGDADDDDEWELLLRNLADDVYSAINESGDVRSHVDASDCIICAGGGIAIGNDGGATDQHHGALSTDSTAQISEQRRHFHIAR